MSFAIANGKIFATAKLESKASPGNQAYWNLTAKVPARGIVSPVNASVPMGSKWRPEALSIGLLAESTGTTTLAFGYAAKATATTVAIAIGNYATAGATNTLAVGSTANVDGIAGTAVGNEAYAGASAVSLGYQANAAAGVAIGYQAKVTSVNGFSGGYQAESKGYGVALGALTLAYDRSVCIGQTAKCENTATVDAIGIGYSLTCKTFGILIGKQATHDSGGVAIGWNAAAKDGVALGYSATVTHANSVALGRTSATQRTDSVSIGARDIESTGPGKGLILQSPDGTKYRIAVANGGTISATAL